MKSKKNWKKINLALRTFAFWVENRMKETFQKFCSLVFWIKSKSNDFVKMSWSKNVEKFLKYIWTHWCKENRKKARKLSKTPLGRILIIGIQKYRALAFWLKNITKETTQKFCGLLLFVIHYHWYLQFFNIKFWENKYSKKSVCCYYHVHRI